MFLAKETRKRGVELARLAQSWSKTAVVGMRAVSSGPDYRSVAAV